MHSMCRRIHVYADPHASGEGSALRVVRIGREAVVLYARSPDNPRSRLAVQEGGPSDPWTPARLLAPGRWPLAPGPWPLALGLLPPN